MQTERNRTAAWEGTILNLNLAFATFLEDRQGEQALQTMWEERWARLGQTGKQDWYQRHGEWPPEICPMLSAGQ